jgi:hypothetical protein
LSTDNEKKSSENHDTPVINPRYAEARVFGPAGELFAHGTSTLMVVTGKGLQLGEKKFAGN